MLALYRSSYFYLTGREATFVWYIWSRFIPLLLSKVLRLHKKAVNEASLVAMESLWLSAYRRGESLLVD